MACMVGTYMPTKEPLACLDLRTRYDMPTSQGLLLLRLVIAVDAVHH